MSVRPGCQQLEPTLTPPEADQQVHRLGFRPRFRVLSRQAGTHFHSDIGILPACGELRLETDASALNGLGFLLWQLQDDKWHLIHCGSCFLSDAETCMPLSNSSFLPSSRLVHKCKLFLSGMPFTVYTDHRPLTLIVNSYMLDQIENPKFQRLVLKFRQYQLHAVWQTGAETCSPTPCPDIRLQSQFPVRNSARTPPCHL